MATVLVTGGTGTLGREVITRLLTRKHRTRMLSHRSTSSVPHNVEVITGDLELGRGLHEAVAGIDAVIHCASSSREAHQVDLAGTSSLLQAASASGHPHFVYISIVGVDRSGYLYYKAKRATEELIEQGPLPWTIMRATQFHDFVLRLIHSFGADTLPEVNVAGGMRFQTIDVGEVADHLVSRMEHGAVGHAPDIGGPQVLSIEEMTETYLRVRGRKAIVHPDALPGDLFDVFRSGINLVPDHAVGDITWEAFLRRVYG